jgi:hypothetical protein
MKSYLRQSRADKSTVRRVEICVQRGWKPGLASCWFYKRQRRKCGRRVA